MEEGVVAGFADADVEGCLSAGSGKFLGGGGTGIGSWDSVSQVVIGNGGLGV